ncbi:unnamed protein product [Caenorhabditis auriculariae]|uniref:G-protein coupled receptors family 1 profile domain-containing protein n=1 Tax=Caenorhabditis auriculariae TaxID=2777116 RepID=A0A8S1HEZ6_9PELO|nr:unnamed protein product [Caenorhabditis auriculariae]
MPEIDVGFIPKWLPRFFCFFSFIFNPLLIYLVITQNKCKIGPYRQFLVCFALFDMTYSVVDVIVGMNRIYGEIGVIIRCAFICLSYGIFELHFIYRYIALCRPHLIHWFTRPLYIFGWFLFWLSFGIYWGFAGSLAYFDKEDREFLRGTFLVSYKVNIDELGLIGVRYKTARPETLLRYCIALGMANVISISVIVSYVFLGYKVILKMIHTYSIRPDLKGERDGGVGWTRSVCVRGFWQEFNLTDSGYS